MIFLYSRWMQLPLSTKALLAKQFGFAKTGSTHVSGNRIVDDGYKIHDVETSMNVVAIQHYLGKEYTDFSLMWDDLLTKVEGRVLLVVADSAPLTISIPTPESTLTPAVITVPLEPKKRGRPAKK